MVAKTYIKVYCTEEEKKQLSLLAGQCSKSVSQFLLESLKDGTLSHTPKLTLEKEEVQPQITGEQATIWVYCSAEKKQQLTKLAKQYNVSLSRLMLSAVTGIKLISEADYMKIKEISTAAGIVGKYTGMLKIHLNRYELKDYTQKQIMREFKLACEARKKLLALSEKMLADCSDS